MKQQGPFVILSGPSGSGKTSLINKCLDEMPQYSNTISWTTRQPRTGEKEGEFYYFTTKELFEQMKQKGELLEWAKVHNEFYATPKKEVQQLWDKGKAIIKDVDVQGCNSIKQIFPQSVSVFICPPSMEELKKRILKRGTEKKKELETRLSIAAQEISRNRIYDFKIINDSFEEALAELKKILKQSLKYPSVST